MECSEVNATNQGIRGIKQNLKDQKPLGIKARVSVNSGFRKPHDRKNMPAIAHASQSKLVTAVDVGPQSKNIKATQVIV